MVLRSKIVVTRRSDDWFLDCVDDVEVCVASLADIPHRYGSNSNEVL